MTTAIRPTTFPITRGTLHFAHTGSGQFTCQELLELPGRFAGQWSADQIRAGSEEFISVLRNQFAVELPQEERERTSEDERLRRGAVIFDEILSSVREQVKTKELTPFEEFLFWISSWWYYHPEVMGRLHRSHSPIIHDRQSSLVQRFLVPLFPEEVRKYLDQNNAKPYAVAVGYGHFAVLFDNDEQHVRYIVTDRQLYEYHDVYGYGYLDILPDGRPVSRSRTSRGGERAFFDGTHLMSHRRFQTCAPKTVVVDGGYKVNSTGVTIINGKLFSLIESDDALSHSTGVEFFFGIALTRIRKQDALASFAKVEETAARLKVDGDTVFLDGHEIKPIGLFQASHVRLLDSGFALYEWSEFVEIPNYHYQHLLVIDDKQDWINAVQDAFAADVETISAFHTNDKRKALQRVLEEQPAALLLDMHLTVDEEFDGLWIANQLHNAGFKGTILITSGYGSDKLRAMAQLIKVRVKTPGKDLERVRQCLLGKDC